MSVARKFVTLLVLVLAIVVVGCKANHPVNCEYAPGMNVNTTVCCDYVSRQFSSYWASGEFYLTSYLASLKEWNCKQFDKECQQRTFAYTRFSGLVYDRFCGDNVLVEQCSAEVIGATLAQNSSLSRTWQNAVNGLDATKLSDDQLRSPCLQIAMYERDSGGFSHYHEVIQPFTPFCSFVWCGFDEKLVKEGRVSVWTCLPQSCRSSIIVMMVFSVLLAIAIIVANATVLSALGKYPRIRHNQAIYRFSLALADIVVGLIVFPTFVSSLYMQFHGSHELGKLRNVTGVVVNGSLVPQQFAVRDPSGQFSNRVPRQYRNFVGFFTVLSLSVSIYTLVAAGIDRCVALSFPARYRKTSKVPIGLIANICIWILSVIFAVLPFAVDLLGYTLVASILVSSSGPTVLILYIIIFVIPLILMWTVTIASYVISRKYVISWRRYSVGDDPTNGQGASESQLARTFGIMVGVFSLSLVPSIIVLICGATLSTIYYNRPNELIQESAVAYTSTEIVVIFILMCNSLWNCFIYSVRDRDFRAACKEMYGNAGAMVGLKCWQVEEVERTNGVAMEGGNSDDNFPQTLASGVDKTVVDNAQTTTI